MQCRTISLTVILLACGMLPVLTWSAQPPQFTGMPAVNASTLVANGTTLYRVSTTVSDADGYDDIRCIRVLFNYTEAQGNPDNGRGYMAWGKTDADITQYGGTWTLANASGGRWGYMTSAWGGTTYITPLSCQSSTVSGSASGGTGSRTVTWTFTAKPAFAWNPVMNDADAWAADGVISGTTYITGWLDNLNSFDVVATPCSVTCTTPQAPVASNLTVIGLNLQIDPADSDDNLYCLRVSPGIMDKQYIQPDGTVGTTPRWNTRSGWSVINVAGLLPGTDCRFSARASRSLAGYCPSAWSAETQVTMLSNLPVFNPYQGVPFSPWVRGQSPYRSFTNTNWPLVWNLTTGSLARGLAGGLDADTYDWRDIDSGSVWGTGATSGRFTTLEFLQMARDHNAAPMLTANVFGGGYRDPNQSDAFLCRFANPDTLAADWVRYTNVIVQNYRQGDEASLTGEDLRVYNTISNWATKPKLLTPGEAPVPPTVYWEIGNEPELGGIGGFLLDHYLSPTDYCDRYKLISQAMRAVDPALKFGPCLMNTADVNGSGLWLAALAADPTVKIDFVSYHPYYFAIKNNWGTTAGVTTALTDYKAFLRNYAAGTRAIMTQHGRTGYELIASEWNAVNWDAPSSMQHSMANGLAVVETCFTFAEDGVRGGNFWEQPQGKTAVRAMFSELVTHMGDVLIGTFAQMGYTPAYSAFRVYVTRHQSNPSRLMIWGLNFDEHLPVTVEMGLDWCTLNSATLRRYGKPGTDAAGGDTSLSHTSGLAWEQADVTAGFDVTNFALTLEDAEITLLILDITPIDSDDDGVGDFFDQCPGTIPGAPVDSNGCPIIVPADFNGDWHVDEIDFDVFSACYNGPTNLVSGDCLRADFNNDHYVDAIDFDAFSACYNGPTNPPGCN